MIATLIIECRIDLHLNDITGEELKKIKNGIDSSLQRDKDIMLIRNFQTIIKEMVDFLPEGIKEAEQMPFQRKIKS